MKGAPLGDCCKAGNEAAFVIIKSVGCTFPKDKIINFESNNKNSILKI